MCIYHIFFYLYLCNCIIPRKKSRGTSIINIIIILLILFNQICPKNTKEMMQQYSSSRRILRFCEIFPQLWIGYYTHFYFYKDDLFRKQVCDHSSNILLKKKKAFPELLRTPLVKLQILIDSW